jgi:hypothetical protein
MVRTFLTAAAALSLAISTAAGAVPCKDPKTGRFIKCPPKPAPPKKCRDAKGHFAKCGTPGAKPA